MLECRASAGLCDSGSARIRLDRPFSFLRLRSRGEAWAVQGALEVSSSPRGPVRKLLRLCAGTCHEPAAPCPQVPSASAAGPRPSVGTSVSGSASAASVPALKLTQQDLARIEMNKKVSRELRRMKRERTAGLQSFPLGHAFTTLSFLAWACRSRRELPARVRPRSSRLRLRIIGPCGQAASACRVDCWRERALLLFCCVHEGATPSTLATSSSAMATRLTSSGREGRCTRMMS